MSQHSEELRTKVREALIERLQAFSAGPVSGAELQLADTLEDMGVTARLADFLSYGVAAAIDAADTEAWLSPRGEWGANEETLLNRILDALKGT